MKKTRQCIQNKASPDLHLLEEEIFFLFLLLGVETDLLYSTDGELSMSLLTEGMIEKSAIRMLNTHC